MPAQQASTQHLKDTPGPDLAVETPIRLEAGRQVEVSHEVDEVEDATQAGLHAVCQAQGGLRLHGSQVPLLPVCGGGLWPFAALASESPLPGFPSQCLRWLHLM